MGANDKIFVLKGYGVITSQIASFLIIEKNVDPKCIHIFEDKPEIGGCWVDANTHSETFLPVFGDPRNYYFGYERIQRNLRGKPLNRASAIHNLRSIHEELKFNLHLNSKIIEEDEREKVVTVQDKNGSLSRRKYDVLISPWYREMDAYSRPLSLRDGLRKVDLAKYDRFRLIGNSLNTAEAIHYVIKNKRPIEPYEIDVYFRRHHPVIPRMLPALMVPGLPWMYAGLVLLVPTLKFFKASNSPGLVDYCKKAMAAQASRSFGPMKAMAGDLLFHPFVATKLNLIQFSGDVDSLPEPDSRTLVIDTRNETRSNAPARVPSDHLRLDMGTMLSSKGGSFVTVNGSIILYGMCEAIWETIAGRKADDKYFRLAERSVAGGRHGTTFWHYAHDPLSKVLPFTYFLFPIDTEWKLAIWTMWFVFLRMTGLMAFFIKFDELAKYRGLRDESRASYEVVRADWIAFGKFVGLECPYPVTERQFNRVRNWTVAGSLFGALENADWYRKVRRFYVVAFAVLAMVVLGTVAAHLVRHRG